jgi:hypothetical protein
MRFNLPIFLGTLILFAAIGTAILLGYYVTQLITGFVTLNPFNVLVTVFLIVLIVVLIYVLLQIVRRQRASSLLERTPRQPRELSLELPFLRRRTRLQTSPSSPDSQLENRLISLLAGDRAAAQRLVEREKLNHPGMSEDWYWHRVIEDLERDRR